MKLSEYHMLEGCAHHTTPMPLLATEVPSHPLQNFIKRETIQTEYTVLRV